MAYALYSNVFKAHTLTECGPFVYGASVCEYLIESHNSNWLSCDIRIIDIRSTLGVGPLKVVYRKQVCRALIEAMISAYDIHELHDLQNT